MSYQLTTIAQYGVRLTHDEATAVFLDVSERQFRAELAREAEDIYDLWERAYVGSWLTIALEYDETDPVEFFGKYEFCQRLVPPDREHRETPHGRRRYRSDFRCDDASRRDVRLYDASVDYHFFGVYLASNGYAYRDDLDAFTRPVPRIAIDNFTDFCAPALMRLGIAQPPALHLFQQIW